jgi:hypothetical protein
MRKRKEVMGLEEEKEEDSTSDEILSYKLASVVYRQATKAVPSEWTLGLAQ